MLSKRSRALTTVVAITLVLGVLAAPGPSASAAEADADWSFRTEAPHDIWSEGGNWAVGTLIQIVVNDPISGPEFADTVEVEQTGPNPGDVGWWLNTGDFEIEPGDTVTVDDGVYVKNLDVLALTIDDVDMTADTISGTAPADTTFPVHASDGVADANVDATSDSGGAWTADFAGLFDIRPSTWGSAAIFDAENDATQRSWHIRMPLIEASPGSDVVQGHWWDVGISVSVTIDDPANGVGVDWSDSGVAVPIPWADEGGFIEFSPGLAGFDLAAGHEIVMTDGITEKLLTVAPISITEVDTDADLVHGTASPDASVSVWVNIPESSNRTVTAAGDGTWTADFSVPGDGWDAHDVTFGDQIGAWETDDDQDTTRADTGIPNPMFSVETPNQIWSHGDGWIADRTVTISVDDDHDLLNGVLYDTTAPVTAWGPSPWEVGWNATLSGFDVLPGHVVTVDDAVDIVRTLDVVDIAVTTIDEGNDTISGIAPPDAWLDANAGDGVTGANRRVQADSSGVFTVDFGNPGVEGWEQDLLDLRPGVGGSVQVFDYDGDSTHHSWRIADPYFGVDVIHEELWANDWPIGATLDFQVFEPDDLVNPVWSDSTTVVDTPWGQTEAGYRFWGDFDVHGGQVIIITDGSVTKELIVSTLEVTNVDPDNDTYTGIVDPGVDYDRTHEVCAWARDLIDDQHGVELCTIPDAAGDWSIDFTGVGEIFPGEHTGAYQIDPDGDQTSYSWHVPPWLYVEIGDDTNPLFPDRVGLDQWVFPVELTNGTDTVTVFDADGDTWEVVDFDVTPGETITATGDDGRVKQLYLEELSVDTVTLWNEDPPSTVYGSTTASYEGGVQVTASADYGWWTERWVNASGGSYEADFANPGNGWREQELGYFGQGGADDVYSGGEIRAHIYDADNDQVQAIWHASNPRIIIVRGNDRIEAIDFPLGEPLTIELDDPNTPELDFTETGVVATNPEKPWETLLIFELGDYTVPDEATVTALDDEGTPLAETEVIPFTIDLVDPDAETITGTAPEGAEVLVQADGNWRYPIADATNTWVADFSIPGDQPGEENPVDIGPGSSGGATLLAEGGSATTVLWALSNAAFSVDPEQEHIWGWEFASNDSVAITIGGTDHGPFPTDDGGNFDASFDPATVNIAEGVEVIVSDGETEKSHTVTGLGIAAVDEALDQVTGVAESDTTVHVWVNDTGAWRDVTAVGGTWVADFAGEADIGPGSNGGAQQWDDDGDSTHLGWFVADPVFSLNPWEGWVWGNGWQGVGSLTISTNAGTLASDVPVDGDGNWGVPPLDPSDVGPGTLVTVSGGGLAKTLLVEYLTVEDIDPAARTVLGTADPMDLVLVNYDEEGAHFDLTVEADENGDWMADFTGLLDEFRPNAWISADIADDDGDSTNVGVGVPNPFFQVETPYTVNSAGSDGWVLGRTITMTIDDDADPGNGILYSATEPVVEQSEGPPQWGFYLEGLFEIEPGHVVTIDDGVAIVRSHVVELITIDTVDEEAELVFGTAEPFQWLHVNYDEPVDPDGYEWNSWNRDVQADVDGNWVADFANPGPGPGEEDTADINQNGHIGVEVFDDDGDYTWRSWHWPQIPTFSVETPFSVWSRGGGWVEGRTVTLIVDVDDDVTNGFLYTDTTPIELWGPEETGWDFYLEGVFEVEPGHFVSVYDGVETFKYLWVEELEITEIDEEADTVSGTAPPFAIVEAFAWNEDPEYTEGDRTVEADADGFWTADFANPGPGGHETGIIDIQIGSGGAAQIFDVDGDSSHRGWYLEEPPMPNFFVRPDGDEIWGSEWYGGPEVTITIDDDDDPAVVLFETVIGTEDGEFYEWIDFDILPGHYMVVTDGEFTKSHWVTELMVTEVDADADMVHGTAEPGTEVFVGSSLPGTVWEHLNFQFGPDNRNPDSLNEFVEFRQAIAYAVDRDLLVAEIPGAGYAIDSYVDAFIPELSQHAWSQYPYDPAAAAALISDLCVDLGRDCVSNPPVAVLTTTSEREDRQIMADLLVPMLDAAGVELQLDLEPGEEFFGETLEMGTWDVGEWAWPGANHLPRLSSIHWIFDPEERFEPNYYNWGTPDSSVIDANTVRMAELIGLMDATDDQAEIETYVAEAELILADQAVIIPLYVREGDFEIEGPFRIVTADANGDWTADFSVPWEDQDPLDIAPGVGGYAEQSDEDGDATHAGWAAPSEMSPMLLKQQAGEVLAELLDSGTLPTGPHLRVASAASSIEHSLQPWRWVDDYHLDPDHGSEVFWYERMAALSLETAQRMLAQSSNGHLQLQEVLESLAAADRLLAQVAIDDATAAGGDDDALARAALYMDRGDGYAEQGRESKAIKEYGKAWEWAISAL